MSAISARFAVTGPTDSVRGVMSGGDHNIPVLVFGSEVMHDFEIALNTNLLSPAEQIDWLRKLAAEAERLAVEVAVLHGEPLVLVGSGS